LVFEKVRLKFTFKVNYPTVNASIVDDTLVRPFRRYHLPLKKLQDNQFLVKSWVSTTYSMQAPHKVFTRRSSLLVTFKLSQHHFTILERILEEMVIFP
jgi:hypothetical protein